MRLARTIELARQTGEREPPVGLLILRLALGDTTRALDEMERATDAGDFWPTYITLSAREFDPIRRSARFAAIVRRVGLDEAVFTSPTGGRPK